MKRIIAFILVMASLLTLCACGGGKKVAPEAKELSLVDKSGHSRFMIITYLKAGSAVTSVTQLIASELRKNVGGIYRISTSAAIKDDKNAYEILVGATGREESLSLAEGIAGDEYRVKVIGRKIVVVGGNDIALARGVGALLSAIDYEKKSVPKNLNISGTVGGHSEMLVGMANQTSKCVEVYDISGGRMDATSLVWRSEPTPNVSGFKLRNHPTHGNVVLVTAGTNASMISYETKEVLWSTENTPRNSHSIELMPNGIIAVGGTVGHAIHFYNLNSDDPTAIRASVPHHDAHGVLWDPKNEILWGAGKDMLFAYRVTVGADGSVNVVKDEEMSVITPEADLHDLQPYTGNPDWLLITTGSKVLVYDKVNKTFKDAFEGITNAVRKSVKGIGLYPNGDLIYIYPDGLHELWNSTILNYVQTGESRVSVPIDSNMGRFYKCRVWSANYQ